MLVMIYLVLCQQQHQSVFDEDGLEFVEPSVEGSLVLTRLRIFAGNDPTEPQLVTLVIIIPRVGVAYTRDT